jgi:transcriptional regulator with XRE-family HTH domain
MEEADAALDATTVQPGEITDATASAIAAIGVRIRGARQARSMTLQALADATGLSPSMLSLVERGRASPSIGSLIVISAALGVTMSEIIVDEPVEDEKLVVRSHEQQIVETAQHVIRRLIRDDRIRGVSIALNQYEPHTGSADRPLMHTGYEYGYVLEGTLTVEVNGVSHEIRSGDLIAYDSHKPHRMWNHGEGLVRTLWFNINHD